MKYLVVIACLAVMSARASAQGDPAPPPADPAPAPDATPPAPASPPPAAPIPPPAAPVATPLAGQIRVAVECEQQGRTKACPAFLLGIVDENKVLLNSPRAGADVVVYATANEINLVDRLHLRFVGHLANAPSVIEVDVDVDTRATDDQQRAQLTPAFLQGVGLFVRSRYPDAVKVELTTPANMGIAKAAGSPWGVMLNVSGSGNYTQKYRSATMNLAFVARYVTRRFRWLAGDFADLGFNRQPPLTLDDGTTVSLDSNIWGTHFGSEAIKLFNDSWSLGVGSYTDLEDPKAQYHYHNRTRAALEWDMFPADDPRGNRLAVFYHLGWQVERYNIRNVLGERFAQYPSTGIDAVGSVRHDHMSYGLQLSSDVQVNHPERRHQITAAPFVTLQVGTHVDINASFSVSQRIFPKPDESVIDPSDYAQLSRLSFAEPLQITASLGLSFHWDPTNGVRNDRIESI